MLSSEIRFNESGEMVDVAEASKLDFTARLRTCGRLLLLNLGLTENCKTNGYTGLDGRHMDTGGYIYQRIGSLLRRCNHYVTIYTLTLLLRASASILWVVCICSGDTHICEVYVVCGNTCVSMKVYECW